MNEPSTPLILRYRPADFSQIRGHDGAVAALKRRLADVGHPHTYLLTGPSGVGKTTIARLIGAAVGAQVEETDAASNSGVDAMRQLVSDGAYVSPGASAKLYIVDECHRLSGNAWDAMLKTLEEPPPHLYWALATTDFGHVPKTVVTRSYHIQLDRVAEQVVREVLVDVIVAENWGEIVQPEVFDLITEAADGSPRQALALLETAFDAPDVDTARRILASHSATESVIDVVKTLIGGRGGWEAVRAALAQVPDDGFSDRSLVHACRYVIGALTRTTDERQAKRLGELLAALTYPNHSHDPKTVFVAAVSRALWAGI